MSILPSPLSEISEERQFFIVQKESALASRTKKLQNDIFSRVKDSVLSSINAKEQQLAVLKKLNVEERVIRDTLMSDFFLDLAKEMQTQFSMVDSYFDEMMEDVNNEKILENLLNRIGYDGKKIVKGGLFDSFAGDFSNLNAVKQEAVKAISAGIDMNAFVKDLRVRFLGADGKLGMIEGKAYNAIFDIYQQNDRSLTKEMSDLNKIKYFVYQGGLMDTSRPFCIKRNNQVYTKEQIESWKNLEFKGKSKPYNPFIDAGGYNCRHTFDPISEELAEELGVQKPDPKKPEKPITPPEKPKPKPVEKPKGRPKKKPPEFDVTKYTKFDSFEKAQTWAKTKGFKIANIDWPEEAALLAANAANKAAFETGDFVDVTLQEGRVPRSMAKGGKIVTTSKSGVVFFSSKEYLSHVNYGHLIGVKRLDDDIFRSHINDTFKDRAYALHLSAIGLDKSKAILKQIVKNGGDDWLNEFRDYGNASGYFSLNARTNNNWLISDAYVLSKHKDFNKITGKRREVTLDILSGLQDEKKYNKFYKLYQEYGSYENRKQQNFKEQKGFKPAKDFKEAEAFVKKIAPHFTCVSWKGAHVDCANDWNKTLMYYAKKFPEVVKQMRVFGTIQGVQKQAKQKILDAIIDGDTEYIDYKQYVGLYGNESKAKTVIKKYINKALRKGGASGEFAHSWGGFRRKILDNHARGIKFNLVYAKDPLKSYKAKLDCFNKKWSSKSGNPFSHTGHHEMAHQLDLMLGFSRDPDFIAVRRKFHDYNSEFYSKWAKKRKAQGLSTVTREFYKDNLSQYAYDGKDPKAETIAECWAEYVLSDNPRPYAKAVGDLLVKKYNQKFGTNIKIR